MTPNISSRLGNITTMLNVLTHGGVLVVVYFYSDSGYTMSYIVLLVLGTAISGLYKHITVVI